MQKQFSFFNRSNIERTSEFHLWYSRLFTALYFLVIQRTGRQRKMGYLRDRGWYRLARFPLRSIRSLFLSRELKNRDPWTVQPIRGICYEYEKIHVCAINFKSFNAVFLHNTWPTESIRTYPENLWSVVQPTRLFPVAWPSKNHATHLEGLKGFFNTGDKFVYTSYKESNNRCKYWVLFAWAYLSQREFFPR